MPNDNSNMVNQIRILTSKVLFALSVNNFSAVFNRISGRLQELAVSNDENPDHTDIELIQVSRDQCKKRKATIVCFIKCYD